MNVYVIRHFYQCQDGDAGYANEISVHSSFEEAVEHASAIEKVVAENDDWIFDNAFKIEVDQFVAIETHTIGE